MMKTSVVNFITGAQYCGNYHHATQCMDGFGSYIFPGGSEYRGFFKNGKFHGYGCFSLIAPSKFLFIGIFENGKMVKIEEMVFSDGLRFQCNFHGKKIDFSSWNYATTKDRRYVSEIAHAILPVGPDSFTTSVRPSRLIKAGLYDTEEGFYNPRSGFTGTMHPPTQIIAEPDTVRFVCCLKERLFILKNCRRGELISLPEPVEVEFQRDILLNNLKNLNQNVPCVCNEHFRMQRPDPEKSGDSDYQPSSLSCDSKSELSSMSSTTLTERSLKLDMRIKDENETMEFNLKQQVKNSLKIRPNMEHFFRPARLSEIANFHYNI